MRLRARDVLVIAAFLAGLAGGVAIAQDKPADQMEMLREQARADKKVVVATALSLTEGEAKAFWPVYNAYQNAVNYLTTSGGFELGSGPSIVVLDAGFARALTTTTIQHDIYAVFFDQRGLMAGLGLQGSKISRMNK